MLVFVDSFDLATLAALRYARSLRPTTLRAVHFVIDGAQAERLREHWVRSGQDVPLELIDCPGPPARARGARNWSSAEAEQPGTQVTVVLPRRSFAPLLGRLLHDRTADKIAGGGQPDPERRRHHHPVRRGEPGPGAGGTAAAARTGGNGTTTSTRPGNTPPWRPAAAA